MAVDLESQLRTVLLIIIPVGESTYTLEELRDRTGFPKGVVYRNLKRVCQTKGWSLRINNRRPYSRQIVDGRVLRQFSGERKKGEPFRPDPHEPTWEPTRYTVVRPLEDIT